MSSSKSQSNTGHLFRGRKPAEPGRQLTSERIAADLAAFRKAGGRIEVLGVTPMLKKLAKEPAPTNTQPIRTAGNRRGSR